LTELSRRPSCQLAELSQRPSCPDSCLNRFLGLETDGTTFGLSEVELGHFETRSQKKKTSLPELHLIAIHFLTMLFNTRSRQSKMAFALDKVGPEKGF
jgi:hypothetical protein